MLKEEAQRIAKAYLEECLAVHDEEEGDSIAIFDDMTIERPMGWVFMYDSQKYIETGDYKYALMGNIPVVVLRDSGDVVDMNWEGSLAASIERFEKEMFRRK